MLLRFLTSATRALVFIFAERCRTTRSFSACQTSGTSRSELPNWERTCQMITLTRDLNVFTSCITTDLPAVFFSIREVAQARNMCALSCILFRHFLLLCSYSDPFASRSPNSNSANIRLLRDFVFALNVNDFVRVGRPIAASVFGRRGRAISTNRRQRSRGLSDPNPLSDRSSSCYFFSSLF